MRYSIPNDTLTVTRSEQSIDGRAIGRLSREGERAATAAAAAATGRHFITYREIQFDMFTMHHLLG